MLPEPRGPFYGPDGEMLQFFVCTKGEKPNCLIGPFFPDEYERERISNEMSHCENAHFLSARAFEGAHIIAPASVIDEYGHRATGPRWKFHRWWLMEYCHDGTGAPVPVRMSTGVVR